MRLRHLKLLGIACAVVCLTAGLLADPAFAQAPGQPQVTVNPDNSVTVSFVPASPAPTTG